MCHEFLHVAVVRNFGRGATFLCLKKLDVMLDPFNVVAVVQTKLLRRFDVCAYKKFATALLGVRTVGSEN